MKGKYSDRAGVRVEGIGRTPPVKEDERSIPEMVLEAVELSLDDAECDFDDVDAIVTASMDLLDGLTASNLAITEVVGAVMNPETRIAGDGLAAVAHGVAQVKSGAYDTVLIVAHSKPSMVDYDELTAWAMNPIYFQSAGVDFRICEGLQARLMCEENVRESQRHWAQVAAQRLKDANGPNQHLQLSPEDILESPPLATPLREAMRAPLVDRACAVVLTSEKKSESSSASVIGTGGDLSSHSPGNRDLRVWKGLERACQRAYKKADIKDPTGEIDLLEPSCRYPHEEKLFIEAAGVGEEIPLSPCGGLFAGWAPVTAGLSRLAVGAKWLSEEQGRTRALVHGTWGPAGQAHAVAILEGLA